MKTIAVESLSGPLLHAGRGARTRILHTAAKPSCVIPRHSSSLCCARGGPSGIELKVSIRRRVEFGQSLGVMGPEGWERGFPLTWSEGDLWVGTVPRGVDFKLAVLDEERRVLTWEEGPNRCLSEAAELQAHFPAMRKESLESPCASENATGGVGTAHPVQGPYLISPQEAAAANESSSSSSFPPSPSPSAVSSQKQQEGVPEWAASAVWYQIYPLGAFGCEAENDHEGKPTLRLVEGMRLLGGHLQALGVGCVLFNPLFESDGHGYDTTDYMVGTLPISCR
jgi:hypothetical protein